MPNLPFSVPAHRSAALLLATILVAACGGPTTSSPPTNPPGSSGPQPSSTPSATPDATVGAIDHKTGATDVILRLEEGGGFVPMEFNASNGPRFTLYGDGVIVFQGIVETFPQPDATGVTRSVPWRTAKLDEDQIQEVLDFALRAGGLGTARASYTDDGVADAGNTIFTVRAGGLDKKVDIYALFEETRPGPDAPARAAFFRLAERLRDFDRGGTIDSDVYQTDRFRGVILPRDPAPELKPVAWPWPTIKPSDFKPGDGISSTTFPHRTMTTDEIAALKQSDIDGGLQGLVLKAPDGALFQLILRPLLIDEAD
jgi:hypothetical protein